MAYSSNDNQQKISLIDKLDEKLSGRFISLDPKGYFLIRLDRSTSELIVEHFSNTIDDLGRSLDPETGKPIECNAGKKREPLNTYRGKSAKEVGIQLTEGGGPYPISKIDHALYLGRELQRAEGCLTRGESYAQD